MACRLCDGYQLKASLLEEHVKDLAQRIKELERINETLMNNLKSCQFNENLKFQYQRVVAQNHTLKTEINLMKRYGRTPFGQTNPSTPINQSKIARAYNFDTSETFSLYQTPRVPVKILSRSSEKMSTFLKTMKKNLYSKNEFFKRLTSNQSNSRQKFKDRLQSSLLKERNQGRYQNRKDSLGERKKLSIQRNCQGGKYQKLKQVFEPSKHKDFKAIKGKNLIEMLVRC